MTKIQVRRGSAVAWSAANPVLAAGEPGFDETAKRMKMGDGATAWNALPYQGIGGRDTASHTTASLAAAAAEDFTLALSKSFALFKVETDVQARVRVYASAAYRAADAARAVGVDPTGDHGLIAEVVTTPSMLSVWLSPVAVGGAADGGATVYGRIDNTGAGATAVAATVTYVTLEG